jgi:hypothetical protein
LTRHPSSSLVTSSERAVSSVVEHYLDTVGVRGSNPLSRTISVVRPKLSLLTLTVAAAGSASSFATPQVKDVVSLTGGNSGDDKIDGAH